MESDNNKTTIETNLNYTNLNNNNIDNNNFFNTKNESEGLFMENNVKNAELLLKPLKKRIYEQVDNNYEEYRVENGNNTLKTDTMNSNEDNMTKQELYEKVVDSMFSDIHNNGTLGKMKSKETRKSGRACKGKRYEEFMVYGKLFKNKRERKINDSSFTKTDSKFESELNHKLDANTDDIKKIDNQTPKLDLENTIKRLAERTNTKLENHKKIKLENNNNNNNHNNNKTSTDKNSDNYQNSYFNLELRIAKLPFLSYDNYIQRKRDSKKRKQFKKSPQNSIKHKGEPNKIPVGSKKRKNKNNITHLEKSLNETTTTVQQDTDLSGLATLAEIAANKERINE